MRARWVIAGVLLFAPLRAEGASMVVESVVGMPGEEVEVAVRLATDGDDVAATLTEFSFDPAVPVAPRDSGNPDCTSALGSSDVLSGFSYRPGSCTVGVDCEGIRGAILSFEGTLSDGVLFRCRFEIPAGTPPDTTFPLDLVEGIVSDPSGTDVDVTEDSRDGTIVVVDDPLCVGDCDEGGSVTVAELVRGIDRGLERERQPCAFSDRDADGKVDLSELIAAVSNSLAGCPTREDRAPGREVVTLPPASATDER